MESLLSIGSAYDFLTNDITFSLKNKKELASSYYVLLEPEGIVNFSSVIEGIRLSPGSYTLTISHSQFANKFIMNYPDLDICFPFSFNIEYLRAEDEFSNINRITLVEPDNITNHNPNKRLIINISLEYPLQENVDFKDFVYLNGSDGTAIKSVNVLIYRIHDNRIQAHFKDLSPGTCYELDLRHSNIETYQKIVSDGLVHPFCTLSCFCNPESNASCDEAMSCICPYPYTGKACYELQCQPGYSGEHCSECDTGYRYSFKGRCVLEANNEFAEKQGYFYEFVYLVIGAIAVVVIYQLKKHQKSSYEPVELTDKSEETLDFIDLSSKRFDRIRLRQDYDD